MARSLEDHLFAPGPKRVLALDGGGVKGIITIAFLEKLEEILRERSGRGSDFRLSDYFDLVGGTSVGSLLATLIALGHSVAEIKSLFWQGAPAVFRRPWYGIPYLSPRFSSRGLKRLTRRLLGDRTLESPELLTGLAVVTKRVDTGSPWVLTNHPRANYWNDPTDGMSIGSRHYRIADLVRASTAAPFYFAPKRLPIWTGAPHGVPTRTVGLFVDGGVSPFNNPALQLLMLAGLRSYGYGWQLDPEHLLLVSVGTGSYRMPLKPNFLLRRVPAFFAAKALHGLVADIEVLSLTLLQWLSQSQKRWRISAEIGEMHREQLGQNPVFSFVRYDVLLEKQWLVEALGEHFEKTTTESTIEDLKRLDRPDMMGLMYEVGKTVAANQVVGEDFPAQFDVDWSGSTADSLAPSRIPLFAIEKQGRFRTKRRLIALRRLLNAPDFHAVAIELGRKPRPARMIGTQQFGAVQAVYLSGGFEILGSDGKEESEEGYLVLTGNTVSGISRATFHATYEMPD